MKDNVDLKGIDLSWADLSDIELEGGKFEEANFEGAIFFRSILRKGNFTGATFKQVKLEVPFRSLPALGRASALTSCSYHTSDQYDCCGLLGQYFR